MAATPWPGFCGPSSRSQSVLASPARLMNWYVQRIRQGDTAKLVLYPTPGLSAFVASPESPGRGILSQNEQCWAAIGTGLYEAFADGTITNRGTLAVDQYPASMVTNGDGGGQLLIVSGGRGDSLDLATNVLSSNVVAGVNMCGMIDGFGVALDFATSTLKVSDLLDFTTWDPTQIAQRSTAPDPWRALLVKYPRIWLLGEHTGDVWYNAGTAPFPFAPVPSIQIPYGIAAPFTLKAVGSSVMWLTHNENGDGQVVEAQGYNPTVVSTEAEEYAWSQYSRIDDAVAYCYQDQGHEFYVLNFPSGNATWVYDRTEGFWHERGHYDAAMGEYSEWGPQFHTHVFDRHLVLHAENGTIYTQSIDTATDADGDLIRRMRIPPIYPNPSNVRQFIERLQVVLEPGLGLTSGQGSDPQVMLRLSRNGSKTWGNQRSRSAGVQGAYDKRLIWNNCGSGRENVPEIVVTDPIPWRVTDLLADVRQGMS